jgi:hypothetical protein
MFLPGIPKKLFARHRNYYGRQVQNLSGTVSRFSIEIVDAVPVLIERKIKGSGYKKYFSQSVILDLKRPAKNLLQTRDQKKQVKKWAKAVYAWTQSYKFLGILTRVCRWMALISDVQQVGGKLGRRARLGFTLHAARYTSYE